MTLSCLNALRMHEFEVVDWCGFHIRESGCWLPPWRGRQRRSWAWKPILNCPRTLQPRLSPCPGFHPLIDGIKRTAWTLIVLLLWINGYRHGLSGEEGFDLVVGVAAGRTDLLGSAVLDSTVSPVAAGPSGLSAFLTCGRWGPAEGDLWCVQHTHFRRRTGSCIGRIGSYSACFREFQVFSRVGMRFNSWSGDR
jgi:death-on-curing protein